ncbi:unnamed protein product [Ixodes persulcatus]
MDTMRRERKETATYMKMVKDAMERTFWAKRVHQHTPYNLQRRRRLSSPKPHRPGNMLCFFRISTGVKAKERFMDVASENMLTVLMVTEEKPRPALFCEIIVRLHDAEDIEKEKDVPRSLFHRSVSQDINRAPQCAFCKSGL